MSCKENTSKNIIFTQYVLGVRENTIESIPADKIVVSAR